MSYQGTNRPSGQPLALTHTGSLRDHSAQLHAAERMAYALAKLNEQEDEAIRAAGGTVTYLMDERIVYDPR
jgi:hypothetical protein